MILFFSVSFHQDKYLAFKRVIFKFCKTKYFNSIFTVINFVYDYISLKYQITNIVSFKKNGISVFLMAFEVFDLSASANQI
jgi:hypothetical protein